MKTPLILLFSFVIGLNSIFAQESDMQLFQKANQLYEQEKYSKAVQLYEELNEKGYISEDLYFNMGNAYFKSKDIAHSVLYYEKALKINPSGADAAFNLSLANEKTVDKIEAVPELFIYRWWNSMYNALSADRWAQLSVILLLIALIGLCLFFFSRAVHIRKPGFYLFTTTFILALFCWFWQHNKAATSPQILTELLWNQRLTLAVLLLMEALNFLFCTKEPR